MNRHEEILSSFQGITVGVVGDIVADLYIMGCPQRLSREAPVMIVRYEEERLIPGCAANTMNNLLSLGCRVRPVALLGRDETGARLKREFVSRMPMDGIYECNDFLTVTKTRILVGDPRRTKQQVIRIDKEPQSEPPAGAEERILDAIRKIHPKVDAWLVSDYDYFVVTPAAAELLLDAIALPEDHRLLDDAPPVTCPDRKSVV